MSTLPISAISQSRNGTTVTLTFNCRHDYGIWHVHWTQYASNGTSIIGQGEAVMTWNAGGGTSATNFNNMSVDCSIVIPNATAGLYCILDFYTVLSQRTSRRVQFI